MSFHVNQKVVCVDGRPLQNSARYGEAGPRANCVYTIRGIHPEYGFHLAEIVNKPNYYSEGLMECYFNPNRFRPLIDNKSSVSFTMGADPESERWDNRVKIPAKAVSHQH